LLDGRGSVGPEEDLCKGNPIVSDSGGGSGNEGVKVLMLLKDGIKEGFA
jgi:hypothetical protein